MSTLSDVAGTGEDKEKGKTPKEHFFCRGGSWAYDKESYDCHLWRIMEAKYGFVSIV